MNGPDLADRAEARGHVVGFYDAEPGLIGGVAAFVAGGLRDDDAVVVAATGAHRHALEDALAVMGVSVAALSSSGRYQSLDARETLDAFMRGGSPDPALFASTIESTVVDAGRAGNGVRVFGEMVALLWDQGDIDAAIELESLWSHLGTQQPFSLLCAYPAAILESDSLGAAKLVCDQHSHVTTLSYELDRAGSRPPGGDSFVRSFAPTPASLRAVRGFVADALHCWQADDHTLDAAAVIASELATNAIAHARSPFRVSLSRRGPAVELAVRDASTDPPRARNRDSARMGGHGIVLVAAFADRWGTRDEPDGKTVWAELTLPGGA